MNGMRWKNTPDLFPTKRRDVRKAGGDFKMVHKLNGGSLGWILNVEWLRSLRKPGEVSKSCAKLNGESLGWIFNVGTGGDFKIVHKLNGDSLGWIFNVEWLRSLRKRGEVLKSCGKLNGESRGWCLPVGTHYYLLLISVQSGVWIGTRQRGGALVVAILFNYEKLIFQL